MLVGWMKVGWGVEVKEIVDESVLSVSTWIWEHTMSETGCLSTVDGIKGTGEVNLYWRR